MSDLLDLRQSTNETARVARANLLLFLVVGLFVGLLVANTNDLLLFTRAHITIPFMQIGVPIDMFYRVGPIIFILLHLNLFLRLARLSQVVALLRKEIKKCGKSGEELIQASLLFPFDFLQLIFHVTSRPVDSVMDKPSVIRRLFQHLKSVREKYGYFLALSVIVAASVFVFPLILLMWMQVKFLPYQSESITFIHQFAIAIDVVMQMVFIFRLEGFRKFRAEIAANSSWMRRFRGFGIATVISFFPIAAVAFSWLFALVPGSFLERNRLFPGWQSETTKCFFDDWWLNKEKEEVQSSILECLFYALWSNKEEEECSLYVIPSPEKWRRYLYLPDTSISASERPAEIVATYLAKGEDPEQAWRFTDPLDLSGRVLRYGWFKSSEIWRANFSGSDIYCTNFENAKLHKAVFDKANLKNVYFKHANLQESSFKEVESYRSIFDEADLRNSKLTSATFDNGSFEDADFQDMSGEGLKFLGTNLFGTRFHGALIEKSKFFGADLFLVEFHGVCLSGAEFRGTDLVLAEFYGVDLSYTIFDSVHAESASFYRTNMSGAKIIGTNLYETEFYDSILDVAEIKWVDAHQSMWEVPFFGKKNVKVKIYNDIKEKNCRDNIKESEGMKIPTVYGQCVWKDGDGLFPGLDVPSTKCWDELENYLIKKVCGQCKPAVTSDRDNWAVASGIADHAQSSIETVWEAHVAVSVLKSHPEHCSLMYDRPYICRRLTDWVVSEKDKGFTRKKLESEIKELCVSSEQTAE